MRWTPAADQLLLLKILETHDLSVDTTKVAEAWPESTDGEPGPTARAIKERIAKIRDLAKRAAGAALDCETPSPSSKRGRGKKGNTSKNTTSSTSTSTPRKRKRKNADAEMEQQSDDKATAEAQLDELLDYPNETPNAHHGYMSPGNPVLSDDDA